MISHFDRAIQCLVIPSAKSNWSIDNAFHVQVMIHLESLDRNCGRLTYKNWIEARIGYFF